MASPIRAYAQALYEASVDQKKPEIKKLVENFLKLLQEKNQLSRIEEVVSEIEVIDNKVNHRIQAEVTSALHLDEVTIKKLEKFVHQRTGAKEVIWEKKIDKNILGGVIIKFQDTVLDLSMLESLEALAEEIKK
jgi:F-type H+-transporting ATPase subunit delta